MTQSTHAPPTHLVVFGTDHLVVFGTDVFLHQLICSMRVRQMANTRTKYWC